MSQVDNRNSSAAKRARTDEQINRSDQIECVKMSEEKLKIPKFDGHFDHWSEIMENLLKAKKLWGLIDPGFEEPPVGIAQNDAQKKKTEELRAKDQQVKHYLYQAIDRPTFEQILDRKTAKSVWNCLKKRYEGNARVKRSMLQKLRRDFEVLEMNASESVSEYFARVITIANQMRTNGENMTDLKIVEKILRTLTEKYTYVVVSIEESRDVDNMTIDELLSTLLVHEQKFKRVVKEEDQALKTDASEPWIGRGRGRGRSGGRGRGRGRGRGSFSKETIECYNCHKLGHFAYECPSSREANYSNVEEEEEILLMVQDNGEETVEMLDEEKAQALVMKSGDEDKASTWFLDSGCSNHMCGDRGRFTSLDTSFTRTVRLGNDTRITVAGKGQVKLMIEGTSYTLSEVYFVPDLKNNLLSIGQLQQKGLIFLIRDNVCKVHHAEKGLLFQCSMSANRMFPVHEDAAVGGAKKGESCMYINEEDLPKLWHERYGHISKSSMESLQRHVMVRGMPWFNACDDVCSECIVGKQTRKAIPRESKWRAKEVLELVHSDICGHITPPSHSGKKYFLSFIDDFSRKAWVYLLTEKSEAYDCFKKFKVMVEKESGKPLKYLRTDRGGEYLSKAFTEFCDDHGIQRQLTTSYTPQQNGVAERKNRTVVNMVITLLNAKKVPKVMWAEAVKWTFYVLNRSPTKALKGITPQEAWSGVKPTVEHFRVWGCLAYAHIPVEKRKKLDDRSRRCVLVGVSEESKAYRLVDPKTMKIVVSKDVVFEENKGWNWDENGMDSDEDITWGQNEYVIRSDSSDDSESDNDDDHSEAQATADQGEGNNAASSSEAPVREGRNRRPPSYLSDYLTGNVEEVLVNLAADSDPIGFNEAVKSEVWLKAMQAELDSIEKNHTWTLVDLPVGAKCIGVKWLYKTKRDENGNLIKHKARLVAKGYGQEYGVDYEEVYAPVARMDTIRLMLALAAQNRWKVYQLDVKSAFLYGTLEEEVYVQQPPGFIRKGKEDQVYKLHKALYGLKQAPRAWFSRIESYFMKEGFKRSCYEHTLFIKGCLSGGVVYVNVYVDDLIYMGSSVDLLEEFKASMCREFDMTDMGVMQYYLGIEVTQTAQGIHLCQQKYVKQVLERFGMKDCNPVHNPIVPGTKLKLEGGEPVSETSYKQMVGSLMYLTATRPDVQFVVSLVSRFMSKPTSEHMAAVKRILRYLQGTIELGLWYEAGGSGGLQVYTDSDFAGDKNDAKSTSGYVVKWNESTVSWMSKKQDIVTLSSTEAEYVAAAKCASQVLWMKGVLPEFEIKFDEAVQVRCDNTSAIKLSKNPVFHGRCRHIGVRFHFLRDLVNEGVVKVVYCESEKQIADIMTKPLKRESFELMRSMMKVIKLGESSA